MWKSKQREMDTVTLKVVVRSSHDMRVVTFRGNPQVILFESMLTARIAKRGNEGGGGD